MKGAFPFLVGIVVVGIAFIYANLDPATHLFPKCPIYRFTGLKCPGCGSQRALHHLFNGHLKDAFSYNPLLVLLIPYLLLGFLFNNIQLQQKYPRFRYYFYGTPAIKILLVTILVYTIVRNL